MKFEEKIEAAKAGRQQRLITLTISFFVVTLLSAAIIYFFSLKINGAETEVESQQVQKEVAANSASEITPTQTIPDEQLRQSYIAALNEYENNIVPELKKIDLLKWDKQRTDSLASLQEEALSKFSAADYQAALNAIEKMSQLAQTMLADSREEYQVALSQAQDAYDADNYVDAAFQVAKALMHDKDSEAAAALSIEIEKLPEIIALLDKISTARIENKHETELSLTKEVIKLVPDRESALKRKQVLIDLINKKNYKSYIAQSYQAIKQGDVKKAKQKITAANNIYPNRQEITDINIALKALENKQRIEKYQQTAQAAIKADDWVLAKQQLEMVLREKADDKAVQQSLLKAATIIELNKEFDQHINNPYRLSKKQVSTKVESKLLEANNFIDASPSLHKRSEDLTRLLEKMSKKISVEVSSDDQTKILVRGVGVVGVTQLKTIQLAPGRYTFEGKRAGYKSKLVDVLIPYDKPSYQISVICDEPI